MKDPVVHGGGNHERSQPGACPAVEILQVVAFGRRAGDRQGDADHASTRDTRQPELPGHGPFFGGRLQGIKLQIRLLGEHPRIDGDHHPRALQGASRRADGGLGQQFHLWFGRWWVDRIAVAGAGVQDGKGKEQENREDETTCQHGPPPSFC